MLPRLAKPQSPPPHYFSSRNSSPLIIFFLFPPSTTTQHSNTQKSTPNFGSLLLQLLLLPSLLRTQLLFPPPAPPTTQWLTLGSLASCLTNFSAQPTNCQQLPLVQECYLIPLGGLCTLRPLSPPLPATTFLQAAFPNLTQTTNITITTNLRETWTVTVTPSNPYLQLVLTLKPKTISFSIISDQNSTKLASLTLAKRCQPFCQTCDNFNCTACKEDFTLLNYQCIPTKILSQLDNLGTQDISAQLQLTPSGTLYLYLQLQGLPAHNSIVPRAYLKNRFHAPIITASYYFNTSEVTLRGENGILIEIPNNASTAPLAHSFLTQTDDVRIYYVDLQLTVADTNYISIEGIVTLRKTKLDSPGNNSFQFFVIPTSCCDTQTVFVECSYQQLSSETTGQSLQTTYRITKEDPFYFEIGMTLRNYSRFINGVPDSSFKLVGQLKQQDNNALLTFTGDSPKLPAVVTVQIVIDLASSTQDALFQYQMKVSILHNFTEVDGDLADAEDDGPGSNSRDGVQIPVILIIVFCFTFVLMLFLGCLWSYCQRSSAGQNQ